MAKKKPEEPPKGAPLWVQTFGDLMNLLLCFFIMLYAMSDIDAEKYEAIAASMSSTFSIFSSGAQAIGDGVMIGNGVSQLNDLAEYVNSLGVSEEGEDETVTDSADSAAKAQSEMQQEGLKESEELSEQIQEALEETGFQGMVDMNFTSQFVELTLNGAILFDTGKYDLKDEALPLLDQISVILNKYAHNRVEIEGHTDNVGDYAMNDVLSNNRALSVFNYVIEHTDLDPANVVHSGRGEYLPVADNSTPEGRALNRRVVIKIYNELSDY
ncbi:MAG: flagellar motor protein MotB [Lachnospiraceae bacterium]|nr:flagellar motor protein MotB [Lachnospiraceae bacterium]